MRRNILAILGIIAGLVILVSSGYFYFFSGQTVYSSDVIQIEKPTTKVTRALELEESASPHKIYMDITYEVVKETENQSQPLFGYVVTVADSRGRIVEQKASSYVHRVSEDQTVLGEKKASIPLLTINKIPSDTYEISIAITPSESLSEPYRLGTFLYYVKSSISLISPLLPLSGLVLSGISIAFYPWKKHASEKTPSNKNT